MIIIIIIFIIIIIIITITLIIIIVMIRRRGSSVGRASHSSSKDPKEQRFEPLPALGAQEKIVRVFPSQKRCADSQSVCPTSVCTRTHKHNHVRMLKIM